MNKLLFAFLFSTISIHSYGQTFNSHIGLNDRLMNSFLLCDRAVTASIAAKYEEVDIIKYNEEYEKFSQCSDEADKVLSREQSCINAAHILLKQGLVCQLSLDANFLYKEIPSEQKRAAEGIRSCLKQIIKICDEFLTEKSIPKAN